MSEEFEVAHKIDLVMRRINAKMHTRIPNIDKDKVGPLGTKIISALEIIQPVPIQELVRYMQRDKSQITRIIRVLEEKQLVIRQKSEKDARISLLMLSNKGNRFAKELSNILTQAIQEILVPLNGRERQQFIDLLRKLGSV